MLVWYLMNTKHICLLCLLTDWLLNRCKKQSTLSIETDRRDSVREIQTKNMNTGGIVWLVHFASNRRGAFGWRRPRPCWEPIEQLRQLTCVGVGAVIRLFWIAKSKSHSNIPHSHLCNRSCPKSPVMPAQWLHVVSDTIIDVYTYSHKANPHRYMRQRMSTIR